MTTAREVQGWRGKNMDMKTLVDFFGSKLNPETKAKRIAELRLDAVRKLGNAYLEIPEDRWGLWAYMANRKVAHGDALVDLLKINSNIMQTYHLAKFVPNKYYTHPLCNMAKAARYDTGEFEDRFQQLMFTIGLDQLLEAYKNLEVSLARFEQKADETRRKEGRGLQITQEMINKLQVKMLFDSKKIDIAVQKRLKGENDEYFKSNFHFVSWGFLLSVGMTGLTFTLLSSITGMGTVSSLAGAALSTAASTGVKSALGYMSFIRDQMNFSDEDFTNIFNEDGNFPSYEEWFASLNAAPRPASTPTPSSESSGVPSASPSAGPSTPSGTPSASPTIAPNPPSQPTFEPPSQPESEIDKFVNFFNKWFSGDVSFATRATTVAAGVGSAVIVRTIFPRQYEESMKLFVRKYKENTGQTLEASEMGKQVEKGRGTYNTFYKIIIKINILRSIIASYN